MKAIRQLLDEIMNPLIYAAMLWYVVYFVFFTHFSPTGDL
jgi:hypothetical protein